MPVKVYKSLRIKLLATIIGALVLIMGGSYYYIILKQTRQFQETIKEQATILTHTITRSIQHDMKGTCQKDIQGIFERIGILPDIESLRIFDESGKVSKSADPNEVGQNVEDIGYEIFKANIPSQPYRGGHGYNAFCMVEKITNEVACTPCHPSNSQVLGIFELCLSMEKTDLKIADNRRFLALSAIFTIILVGTVLSLFLTYQVNRPVDKLVKVMQKAEGGDLHARAVISREDEFGMLAANFNTMIKRLDETQKEVERYHTDQLIRAERLATIGELAAGVAHEIKNPLAGISAAVQVMADDFQERDPRRIITEQIIKQTERMDKTIRDLLNFASPLTVELSRSHIHEVLDRSLFISVPNPAKSGVTIERTYDSHVPTVVVDAKHLEQVFVNVILNAIQAMPGGGTLAIATIFIEAGTAELAPPVKVSTPAVRVVIADSGHGISKTASEKIFTPFFTTRTEGTGLGLSITRRILEIYRATISYTSAVGQGTSFYIDIPLDAGAPSEETVSL